MKRTILAFLALAVVMAVTVQADSLLNNSYYSRSLELQAQAKISFDDGDYDAASDYAAQAQEYARLSDEYVAKMVLMNAAQLAIDAATDRIAWAESVQAPVRFPDRFAEAQTEYALAMDGFAAEDFENSKDHAEKVLVALADVVEEEALPAVYEVRLIPEGRDCLWRIAEYPFVYNDRFKWPVLYDANKATFKEPNNPHLIYPGQLIEIPSLAGERREGTWDPAISYEPFVMPAN